MPVKPHAQYTYMRERYIPAVKVYNGYERRTSMTLGPLEYLVVGFEGNRFTGQILSELRAAREKGIIRVVDLFVLKKDENGNVTSMELSDLSGEEAEQFGSLAGDIVGLLA